MDDFWDWTERRYATYLLAWLEDIWDRDAQNAIATMHGYAAFGQKPPPFARLMGVEGTKHDPNHISKDMWDRFPDTIQT